MPGLAFLLWPKLADPLALGIRRAWRALWERLVCPEP